MPRPPEQGRQAYQVVRLSQVPLDTRVKVARRMVRTQGLIGVPIVPLCFHCHRTIDGHLPGLDHQQREQRRAEKRRQLRANLTAEEVQHIAGVRGQAWVDHHYPIRTVLHGAVSVSKPPAFQAPARPVAVSSGAFYGLPRLHLPGCDFDYCASGCRVRNKPIRGLR